MTQATLSVRVNCEDKKGFENFCEQVGLNASVAINSNFVTKAKGLYERLNYSKYRRFPAL